MEDNKLKAENLLQEIEKTSESKLMAKEDLKRLLEIVYCFNKESQLNEIAFNAKYIAGLMRIIQQSAGNSQINNLEKNKDDLITSIKKFIEILFEIISETGDEEKNYFRLKYFENGGELISNLASLISDLEWLKMYLNRGGKI